jgi:hypothetical protein
MIDDAMEPKKLHPGQTIISVNAASSRVTDHVPESIYHGWWQMLRHCPAVYGLTAQKFIIFTHHDFDLVRSHIVADPSFQSGTDFNTHFVIFVHDLSPSIVWKTIVWKIGRRAITVVR